MLLAQLLIYKTESYENNQICFDFSCTLFMAKSLSAGFSFQAI